MNAISFGSGEFSAADDASMIPTISAVNALSRKVTSFQYSSSKSCICSTSASAPQSFVAARVPRKRKDLSWIH